MKCELYSDLDWSPVLEAFAAADRFVLTTHVRPDTDGIGSEIALHRYLSRIGKEVRILNPDPRAPYLDFLDPGGAVRACTSADHDFIRSATMVVLDVSESDRLGPLEPFLREPGRISICIDHHINNDKRFATINMIDPAAPSTGVLVHDLLVAAGAELDAVIAQAIYATVVADTGCFRFSNTTSRVLRLAADLVELGAEPPLVARAVLGTFSPAKVRLIADALRDAELLCDGRLIWYALSRAVLDAAGATFADAEGVVEYLRLHGSVRAALLFVEQESGRIKMSFRSETGIDVNRLAAIWGGGGHRQASGATVDGPLDEVIASVLERARQLF